MPEGDTIFRTAATMRAWLLGRPVTAARTTVRGVVIDRVVGATVEAVEPRAKHLLIRFSNGLSLHTHMRMTGSWHIYPSGEQWQRPARQARVVIECEERIAVCFNVPVVELIATTEEVLHRSLSGLGPDVLAPGAFDFDEVRRRLTILDAGRPIGEVLLDQRVVSGIGNIYRCESLFERRHNPWTPAALLDEVAFDDLIKSAIRMMKVGATTGRSPHMVYKRSGRPCGVCGTEIQRRTLGKMPRTVFWCGNCQPILSTSA